MLLCGVVPLALLTSYPVARRLINDRRLRLWVAVTYALLPVLLGGTNQGRLTLSVFAIGLPLLVTAVRALVLRRVRTPEAWRGGWGAGVVLVALAAFEPSIMMLALLVGLLGAVVAEAYAAQDRPDRHRAGRPAAGHAALAADA